MLLNINNPKSLLNLNHFWGCENIHSVNDIVYTDAIRITLPKGIVKSVNDKETPAGTGFWYVNRIEPSNKMTLEYLIRFPQKFDFVKGGKLPGIFGGTAPTGGDIANGINGFTSRFMWRRHGKGEVYLYAPHEENNDTGNPWGISLGRDNWRFSGDGSWHKITQAIKLNDPGEKNGKITVTYDGKVVLDTQNIYFRSTNKLLAEGIYFSVFFGGNDLSWAATTNTYIDFAQIEIY